LTVIDVMAATAGGTGAPVPPREIDMTTTTQRLQLALNVRDLEAAIDFYGKMFGATPNKRKPGYANFAIQNPPLKLVLFEVEDAPERLNHLGVEVFRDADVHAATERLRAAGMEHLVEDEKTCCYAKQNKVWAVEPEGLRWEWYRVIDDSESFAAAPDSAHLA
jgi:catechol 2,3-dioxygenase-like lactoylglutathione lyase family enzyme